MDFLVDLYASNGFVNILVVIDRFSKMLYLVLLKDSSSIENKAAAFFENIVTLYGLPSSIVSNHAPCFQVLFWKTLMEKHIGSKLLFSMAYYLETDG